MILGIDISHHQGAPDLAAVRRSGRRFVVVKATEGTGYTDPQFAASRSRAHAAGLVVGLYHFARAGDAHAEASAFAHAVGGLQPGEFVVLDWEVTAPDPAGWCATWLAATRDALGVTPLIYLNQSARDGSDWTRVVRSGVPLWLARYDGSTDACGSGRWPAPAMKQYSESGTVPGVAGPVDLDVFYGTEDELRAHGRPAAQPWEDLPTLHYGDRGPAVLDLQRFMVRVFPSYNAYTPTGNYLERTAAGIAEFQHRTGIADGDGRLVDVRTKKQLWSAGFHG